MHCFSNAFSLKTMMRFGEKTVQMRAKHNQTIFQVQENTAKNCHPEVRKLASQTLFKNRDFQGE